MLPLVDRQMIAKLMTLNELERLFHDKMRFRPALLESERLNHWMSEIVYNLCDSAVFCALHDQLASLGRHAQLTHCFSAVAELLVYLAALCVSNDALFRVLDDVWMERVTNIESSKPAVASKSSSWAEFPVRVHCVKACSGVLPLDRPKLTYSYSFIQRYVVGSLTMGSYEYEHHNLAVSVNMWILKCRLLP